jgi:hypothetical protein
MIVHIINHMPKFYSQIYFSANSAITGPVREFFELVKAIGESKSKQEEDRIVTEEV